jgi:hypothetical protein
MSSNKIYCDVPFAIIFLCPKFNPSSKHTNFSTIPFFHLAQLMQDIYYVSLSNIFHDILCEGIEKWTYPYSSKNTLQVH